MDDRWVLDETNAADTTSDEDSIVRSSCVGPPAFGFLQSNNMIFNVTSRIEELKKSCIGGDCSCIVVPNDQCNAENLISQINNALAHIRATQTSFEKAFSASAETVDKPQHSLENEEEERIFDQLEKGQNLPSESEDFLPQARLEVEKQALVLVQYCTPQ
ncbi:unnamed protein product [Haemonchus placei]|uniref:Fibrous sheath-interacting protein 1 n=1 Tax=Haemonchus placei TaxID=6290 RepID=A0A0N4WD30_HAEPC|nr:unnamed protein product [Haemonchus placei]